MSMIYVFLNCRARVSGDEVGPDSERINALTIDSLLTRLNSLHYLSLQLPLIRQMLQQRCAFNTHQPNVVNLSLSVLGQRSRILTARFLGTWKSRK